MTDITNITIVGSGHGGGAFAAALRSGGYTGEIVLIGDEPHIPYQRPPLSKDYLKDAASFQQLQLKPEQYYHDQHISTHLGSRVESIDPAAKTIALEGGLTLSYGVLVLATGSRPRRIPLPGIDLKGIHELRTIADADAHKPRIDLRIAQPGARSGDDVAADLHFFDIDIKRPALVELDVDVADLAHLDIVAPPAVEDRGREVAGIATLRRRARDDGRAGYGDAGAAG